VKNGEAMTSSDTVIKNKNPEIEVLRAVAIIFVLIQHLSFLFFRNHDRYKEFIHNSPFWGGVDLFFCISGFVIARGLLKQLDPQNPQYWTNVAKFWLRRFYRIAPAMWLWIGILWLGAAFYNHSGAFGILKADVVDGISAILSLSNWHVDTCVKGRSMCGPLPIFWSLSLEEQFYFAFPFILLLPRKFLVPLLLVIVAIQFPIHRLPWEASFGGTLWLMRTDAISLGVLIAIFSKNKYFSLFTPSLLSQRKLRWIVVPLLIFALALIPKSQMVSFSAGAIALVSAALVYIASFDRGYLMKSGVLRSVLEWIGTRSYSIYLIHCPIYWFVDETFYRLSSNPSNYRVPLVDNPFNIRVGLTTAVLLAVVSELNYRFIEVPFRERGRARSANQLKTSELNSPRN
jgi:peptidoglycan/LPS O-acetylase OafA/YrhL